MMTTDQAVLVLIDVQGQLAQVMHDRSGLFTSLQRLIRGLLRLEVPILWLEQNPQRMGPTIPELAELLAGLTPIGKMSFSGCGAPVFMGRLETLGRRQVLLAGIEAHVCVYQTALDLLEKGYEVSVVADAVSSRTPENRDLALSRMQSAGVQLTRVEMLLFELLRTAEHPAFREVLKIVK